MLLHLLLLLSLILTFIDNGNAGITSAFIRTQWPSVDIPLDNEVFAVPKGYNAPQQVHITQGDYDGKAVIISWVTVDEPGSSQVNYGISEGKYDFTAEGTLTNYTFYKYKSGYIHQCLVTDLQYDTKYYYEIGKGASARKFWFETPPKVDPDASYKFGIIGDLGQTYNSLSTLQHYMGSGAKSVLFVGDLSYADRYQYNVVGVHWDTWGRFVEQSAAYQPWIWSAGNHEIEYFPEMERSTGRIIGIGRESQGLYYLTLPKSSTACPATDSPELLHRRLGHPNLSKLQKMVPGLSHLSTLECESCQLGKHTRSPFPRHLNDRAESPFTLVHSDVWGPSRVSSTLGFRYFVSFIDDYSRCTWIFLMKNRSELFSILQTFYAEVQNQFGVPIRTFRSDNAPEYLSSPFQQFMKSHGIIHQTSCPYAS